MLLDVVATHERGVKKATPEVYLVNKLLPDALRSIAAQRTQWPHLQFALNPVIDPTYTRDCTP